MKNIQLKSVDGNVKLLTAREKHEALRAMVAFDQAEVELHAAKKKLAIAARRALRWGPKIRSELTARVAAGRGPTDEFGDQLYGVCKSCGQLVTRYLRGIDGQRVGYGFITSPHACRGRRP